MRLPNGFGNVSKLSGKRRKPWRARVTSGWTIDAETKKHKQKFQTIGYFCTKQEAITALAKYNEDPSYINTITFADVYEKWSEKYFEKIQERSSKPYERAYNTLYIIPQKQIKEITLSDIEKELDNDNVSIHTKKRIQQLCNQVFDYAVKHKYVERNVVTMTEPIIAKTLKHNLRFIFSKEEVATLWQHEEDPFIKIILFSIYTGMRPAEILSLKKENVHHDKKYMIGGCKTDAGKDRIIPIHNNIDHLIDDVLANRPENYARYRYLWKKTMNKLGMSHTPYDTRHSFVSYAKMSGIDEYVLKLIIGHKISDVTEATYTHRNIDQLITEMQKLAI